jgi:DNA-binding MarR family transcriptional regulator
VRGVSSEATNGHDDLPLALDRKTREFNAQAAMFSQAAAGRLGINTTDLRCLDVLSQTGPISAGRLAGITGLTVGAITGIADRLEGAGYARRERDATDRRRVIIGLVGERDERDLAPLFEDVRRASAELYSDYTDEELALLLDFFERAILVLREQTSRLRAEAATRWGPD